MSEVQLGPRRADIQPLPANINSVQPGGGFCFEVERAWGRWRRWYLKRFRPGYVRRMAELRHGSTAGAPHEVLDPRDLKDCRNQCECYWDPAEDRFRWRESLPFARWGLAELVIMGLPLTALTLALALWHWYLAIPPLVVLVWFLSFFRDPRRQVPQQPGVVVAPADGVIAEVTAVEHDEFVGGPAMRIGVFLNIFNVHINRAPVASRVIELRYARGEFLNALRPDSTLRNENMWIGLEQSEAPYRRMVVRQIAGAIARRIVCDLRPGETMAAGHKFGMIKFGSRTELILPAEAGLQVLTKVGQSIKAGSDVLAIYADAPSGNGAAAAAANERQT